MFKSIINNYMFELTNFFSGGGYEAPTCRTFLLGCKNVFCDSLNKGVRESFGGFTNADDDYFDE